MLLATGYEEHILVNFACVCETQMPSWMIYYRDREGLFKIRLKDWNSKLAGQVRSVESRDLIIQYYAGRLTVSVRVIFDKIS